MYPENKLKGKVRYGAIATAKVDAVSTNYLHRSNNLSDLASAALGRANLGLGSSAVRADTFFLQAASNLADVVPATGRLNLGVQIGVDVQAYNGNLTTWAAKTVPSGTVVGTTDAQTLTNKTLGAGTAVDDATTPYFDLKVAAAVTSRWVAVSSFVAAGAVTAVPFHLRSNDTNRLSVKPNGQVRFVPLAADPAGAETGDVYYNSTTGKLRVYNGAWVDLH